MKQMSFSVSNSTMKLPMVSFLGIVESGQPSASNWAVNESPKWSKWTVGEGPEVWIALKEDSKKREIWTVF